MRRIFALSLLCLVAGCRNASEIMVVLSSDVSTSMYDQLSIDVSSESVTRLQRSYGIPDEARLPASFELHAAAGEPTVTIDAQLLSNQKVLVQRKAIVTFVADRALELRLGLDMDCANVPTCANPDDTCIDGTCQPAAIDSSSLPTLSGNPDLSTRPDLAVSLPDLAVALPDLSMALPDLAVALPDLATDLAVPHVDLGAPIDLARPVDLTVPVDLTKPVDLALPADLAMCAPHAPPAAAAGCVNYVFTSSTLDGLTLTAPSDATTSYDCGRLHVHLGAGKHVFPNDVRLAPSSASHKSYTVLSSFTVVGTGDGAAGPEMYAVKTSLLYEGWPVLVSRGVTTDPWLLDRIMASGTTTEVSGTVAAMTSHVASIQSSNTSNTYFFSPTIDGTTMGGSSSFSSSTMPSQPSPAFSVQNGSSGTSTTNAVDVYIDYVQICGSN